MDREHILSRLLPLKGETPLPEMPKFQAPPPDLIKAFQAILEAGASRVLRVKKREAIWGHLEELFPEAEAIASPFEPDWGNIDMSGNPAAADLAHVEVAVVTGRLGVAENGAIWVEAEDCGVRVLPFITQHLILVVEANRIVPHMHAAYAEIDPRKAGYGVFIAGPSKTADIEQALVIGAQGPRSLTVFILPPSHSASDSRVANSSGAA